MKAAVLTISDTRDEDDDPSGDVLIGLLSEFGATVMNRSVVTDEKIGIEDKLIELSGSGVELIITTGGTGLGPRDNTPEATRDVIEKEAPGLAELMRMRSLDATPLAPLSRAVCGIRRQTLIVNLPGSTRGATQNFTAIRSSIPHAIGLLTEQSRKCAS